MTKILSKYDIVKLIHRLLALLAGWDVFAPEFKQEISEKIASKPIDDALEDL